MDAAASGKDLEGWYFVLNLFPLPFPNELLAFGSINAHGGILSELIVLIY